MKKFLAVMGSALMGLMFATIARAAVENVVAQVTFADPVTIVEVNSLQYGIIDHVLNTETIILGTDDSVGGTGAALVIGGTQAAAELTVDAEASQVLTILIDNIIDGTGYALSAFICSYNGGADTACNSLTPTAVARPTAASTSPFFTSKRDLASVQSQLRTVALLPRQIRLFTIPDRRGLGVFRAGSGHYAG
jgi:hypothetical protein